MFRIFAIWFLCLYTISSPLGEQLMKIPVFVVHYYEHQQRDPQISVVQFFKMHYLAEQHKGGDYDRDMQLPFKSVSQPVSCCSAHVVRSLISRFDFNIQQEVDLRKYPVIQELAYNLENLNSIWQPPKFTL